MVLPEVKNPRLIQTREGAMALMACRRWGSFIALIEFDNGTKFCQCSNKDVLGIIFNPTLLNQPRNTITQLFCNSKTNEFILAGTLVAQKREWAGAWTSVIHIGSDQAQRTCRCLIDCQTKVRCKMLLSKIKLWVFAIGPLIKRQKLSDGFMVIF